MSRLKNLSGTRSSERILKMIQQEREATIKQNQFNCCVWRKVQSDRCHRAKPLIQSVYYNIWCIQCRKRKCARKKSWLLHHDRIQLKMPRASENLLDKNCCPGLTTILSYSPNLAPCDFFLCVKPKRVIKEAILSTWQPLIWPWRRITGQSWRNLSRSGWKVWRKIMEKWIWAGGHYFERDILLYF